MQTPIEYGYTEGWNKFLDNIELFIFVLLVIVICVAPIFASEYQTGADHIILSSKLGKTKLITVKIATAFLFGATVLTLHFFITIVIVAFTFGLDGGNTLGNDELTFISFSLENFVIDLYTMRILFYVSWLFAHLLNKESI